MMRLFIALPLETEVEEKLGEIISQCCQKGGSVKWVKPHNIHMTVRFLGDTEEELVEKIKLNMDEVVPEFAPVETAIEKLGGFPNLHRPRVIWTSVGPNAETLGKLARQIELRMRKLRFEAEKKSFKAHLTLGRVRKPRNMQRLLHFLQNYSLEPIPVRFDRLVLFRSTLTQDGPIYEQLHEAPLGAQQLAG
jgi:2'-5' RNA ligase